MAKKKVKSMGIEEVIGLLVLAAKYGIPAIANAVSAFKKANGADPTLAEVQSIMEGVEPPEDFG